MTKSAAIPAMQECVVVQDDEAGILAVMCAMLTAAGYQCRQADSPAEAWAIVKSQKEAGLVLCGLLESCEDGLVERMTETFPDIPVVVVSACGDFSLFEAALRKGAYDYLQKPFGREQLSAVVKRASEYRRLKLENRALRAKLASEVKR